MRDVLALLTSLCILTACHSSVTSASAESAGSGSSGGGGGGAGGASSVDASSGAGGGSAFPCKEMDAAYWVALNGDGPAKHLSSGCTKPMPWGHYEVLPGGGIGLDGLYVYACTAGTPIQLLLRAPMKMVGTAATFGYYTDASGADWNTSGDPPSGNMTITTYGAEGDAIDGTFTIDVMQGGPDAGGAPLSLSGAFHVCHQPDLYAP